MYYMGFYDLFDHLLDTPKTRDEHADAANVTSPSRSRASQQSGRRKTDLRTSREGTRLLRGEDLSPRRNTA